MIVTYINIVMVYDKSLNFKPSILEKSDQRDLFIKRNNKIDDDNYIFNLTKEDNNKLLEQLEKDDEIVKKIRDKNLTDVCDYSEQEKVNHEKYLQAIKKKWNSTIPTILEIYNSGINNPKNKFIL